MTENDLELWKLNCRIAFLEQLLATFLRTVAQSSPDAKKTLQDWEIQIQNLVAGLTFPTNEPVQSDMLAAEAQHCVDHFLSLLVPKK